MPVRVYGLGERPAQGLLDYRPIDALRFVEDLASCTGLVTTAGNQLIGEAIHLGKPVLAMPEPGNYEQHINAHFIRESGAGMVVDDPHALTVDALRRLLARLPDIESRQAPLRSDGTEHAARWVESLLERDARRVRPIAPRASLHA